jgi:hypothetical protein
MFFEYSNGTPTGTKNSNITLNVADENFILKSRSQHSIRQGRV